MSDPTTSSKHGPLPTTAPLTQSKRGSDLSASYSLFFIALGLFGLYTLEFGVVGILPAIIKRYDIGVAEAGSLISLFAFIVATCGPFLVLLMSRINRRKLLVCSLLVFSVCSLASAWADSFGTLMALRIAPAMLHPVFFSVAFATAISLYPADRVAHATAMAFFGTSVGLVLGVPMTAWIAAKLSYEASFVFCALVNALAALGLWISLPQTLKTQATSYGQQLAILRKPDVWLSIVMTICVFGAMFSVYSYAAEYLARETQLSSETISLLLVVFGIGGVLGNLIVGRWLGGNRVLTVLLYPIVLAIAYGVLHTFASASLTTMLPVCLLWGAAHTSGLIVSQVWLTSAAPEASEFATSLYVSAANAGVVFGSAAGGVFITTAGMRGALWAGWLFAALTIIFVTWRILLSGSRQNSTRIQ